MQLKSVRVREEQSPALRCGGVEKMQLGFFIDPSSLLVLVAHRLEADPM